MSAPKSAARIKNDIARKVKDSRVPRLIHEKIPA
jgi:hypothetical protein